MKKTGTIQALNVSPKGFYDGFVLKKTIRGSCRSTYEKLTGNLWAGI